MRLFDDETGWTEARCSVRYTRAALAAVPAHAKLAAAMTHLLATWKSLDAARVEADDATIDANALVHFRDVELDGQVTRLADRTRADHGADSRAFAALFPEPPHEIVRLGLESEIERAKKWKGVAAETSLSKDVASLLHAVEKTCTEGKTALDARDAAAASTSRTGLRLTRWRDDANAARRSVATALEGYANKHGLGRDYADAFFPPTAQRSKRKKPASVPANTPPTS